MVPILSLLWALTDESLASIIGPGGISTTFVKDLLLPPGSFVSSHLSAVPLKCLQLKITASPLYQAWGRRCRSRSRGCRFSRRFARRSVYSRRRRPGR